DHNKPRKAARESAVLVYIVAFEGLGLLKAQFDVGRDNADTLAFHRRFGATETHGTAQDIFFTSPRTPFHGDRAAHPSSPTAGSQDLGLLKAQFDVRRDNANTLAFHRRFGATETHETAQDIFFTYPRTRFQADRAAHLSILTESSQA